MNAHQQWCSWQASTPLNAQGLIKARQNTLHMLAHLNGHQLAVLCNELLLNRPAEFHQAGQESGS